MRFHAAFSRIALHAEAGRAFADCICIYPGRAAGPHGLSHEGRRTDPRRAGVGVGQGCTAAPMIFRWILQHILEPLQEA